MKLLITFLCIANMPAFLLSQHLTSIDIVSSLDRSSIFLLKPDGTTSNNSTHKSNFRVGLNFSFRIFDKTYFKTGIRYAQLGYVESYNEYKGPDQTILFEKVLIDQQYIEVPLIFRYDFRTKKTTIYFEFGLAPHFYLKTKHTIQNSHFNDSSYYRDPIYLNNIRMRLAYIIGFGINHNISKQLQLFVQPTYRFYPKFSNTIINRGQISMGFEFGVRRVISFVDKED